MSDNINKLILQGKQFLSVVNCSLDAGIVANMLTGKSFVLEYTLLYEVFGYDDDMVSGSDFSVEDMIADICEGLESMLPAWEAIVV